MSEIRMSPEIGELAKALALAQTEFKPVFKDADNPYFSSKYADLSSVISATQLALAKNGLVVMQSPIFDLAEQKAGVSTMLAHSSGQWLSNDLLLPATMRAKEGVQRFDAQSVGSAITYARRYSYQAIVGVAAEVDDDGNAATGKNGSAESAKAVADRKIAEHKAKSATVTAPPKTAQKPAGAPANGKNGHEAPDDATVALELIGEGLLALSGKGLAIVKSEMNADDRNYFNIHSHNGKWTMKADLADKFRDLCRRLNVGTIGIGNLPRREAGTRGPMAPEKATIPPFDPFVGGPSNSTDPILLDCVRVEKNADGTPKEKPFLDVTWAGRHHSCFKQGMWPAIEELKKLPVMFETKVNGRYSNITRILRGDGISFVDEQNQSAPDSGAGYGERDIPFQS